MTDRLSEIKAAAEARRTIGITVMPAPHGDWLVELVEELAAVSSDCLRRRLRVNSIAWHTKFHEGEWETCQVSSCTNDHEAFANHDAALARLEGE